jgi:hypothetical protein
MKNLKSFKVFEKYRGDEWFENLFKDFERLKHNPSYWNEEKSNEIKITLTNRDRIIQNIKEIFNGAVSIHDSLNNKEYEIYFYKFIDYSKNNYLKFRIREIDDEYFWIRVYLHEQVQYVHHMIYYICDQEEGLYSLLKEIKKLLDTP